jgi:hypothetical protein
VAKCVACDREMTNADAPCVTRLEDWPRVDRWGDDPQWGDAPHCPDCNCPRGSCHHPGCDVERCSHENQAISCDACDELYPPTKGNGK